MKETQATPTPDPAPVRKGGRPKKIRIEPPKTPTQWRDFIAAKLVTERPPIFLIKSAIKSLASAEREAMANVESLTAEVEKLRTENEKLQPLKGEIENLKHELVWWKREPQQDKSKLQNELSATRVLELETQNRALQDELAALQSRLSRARDLLQDRSLELLDAAIEAFKHCDFRKADALKTDAEACIEAVKELDGGSVPTSDGKAGDRA